MSALLSVRRVFTIWALLCALLLMPSKASANPWMDYASLYRDTVGGVVLIYGESGEVASKGTGAIIRPDGLIITNAHVVLDVYTGRPFEQLTIFTHPGRATGNVEEDLSLPHGCEIVAVDTDLDLALLRMYPRGWQEQIHHIPVGDSESVVIGEPTLAIGHPESGAFWTLTTGQIGAILQDFGGVAGRNMFQMETSVNRGNSGGPLIDGNGQLIGINSLIARQSEDGMAITGINFALRAAVVRDFVERSGELLEQAPGDPEPVRSAPVALVSEAVPRPPPGGATTPSSFVQERIPDVHEREDPHTLAPAPEAERGYRSRLPPGTIQSPRDLLSERSESAFDDLDAALSSNRSATSTAAQSRASGEEGSQTALVLITDSEARLTDARPEALAEIGSGATAISSGSAAQPRVLVNHPRPNSTVAAPMAIDVTFQPSSGARINVSSLEVSYLKMFALDITDRISPYATSSGIQVDEADLPAGTHTIRIRITDTRGRTGETTVRATVR